MRGPAWQCIKETVTGASHTKAGKINQDAVDAGVLLSGCAYAVVSDGHGSAKYVRSHEGARFAVEVVRDYALWAAKERDYIRGMLWKRLPETISRKWVDKVDEHRTTHPVTEEETEKLADVVEGASLTDEKSPNLFNQFVYGATVAGAIVRSDMLLFFQLGDGEIVLVDSDGLPQLIDCKPEGLIGEETTSLCMPDAERHFKVRFMEPPDPPCLIFVSTDGYAKSYADDESFLKVQADLFEMLKGGRSEEVKEKLPIWIEETTSQGSGDDISVAMLWRPKKKGGLLWW